MSYEIQRTRDYVTPLLYRQQAKQRQVRLLGAGYCINGEHGNATHGVRCCSCWLVHRFTKRVVAERPVFVRSELLRSELREIARV